MARQSFSSLYPQPMYVPHSSHVYRLLRGQKEELEWKFCKKKKKKGARGEELGPSPWTFQPGHSSQGPGRKIRVDEPTMSHEISIKSASMEGPRPGSGLKP